MSPSSKEVTHAIEGWRREVFLFHATQGHVQEVGDSMMAGVSVCHAGQGMFWRRKREFCILCVHASCFELSSFSLPKILYRHEI